jgi:glutamate synthase (NADPH/NADH) large chain
MAALMGAEEFGLATASLIAQGCVMLRKCHLNTCSVGIATQDPRLTEKFSGKPEYTINLFFMVAEDVRRYMAKLGFRTVDEMVGRVDMLKQKENPDHWKAKRVDLSQLLAIPNAPAWIARRCAKHQSKDVTEHLDLQLIEKARATIDGGSSTKIVLPIRNTHRSVGAMLSGEIARKHGNQGLPDDAIRARLTGSAGQSFGAFLARGVTLELEGDTNDYLGKGLSGGRVIVYPQAGSRFAPEENIITGNTCLYGATSGEVYISGVAGERFAVRNSGARAVVEGIGDHGCEYMTGGTVVVLGTTGRNFGAGMSGGTAYVLDRDRSFRQRCNPQMVELESLVDESEIWMVYGMIEDHLRHTGSPVARRILDNWELVVTQIVKVLPTEYKRVLQERRAKMRPPRGQAKLRVVGADD